MENSSDSEILLYVYIFFCFYIKLEKKKRKTGRQKSHATLLFWVAWQTILVSKALERFFFFFFSVKFSVWQQAEQDEHLLIFLSRTALSSCSHIICFVIVYSQKIFGPLGLWRRSRMNVLRVRAQSEPHSWLEDSVPISVTVREWTRSWIANGIYFAVLLWAFGTELRQWR